VLATALTHSEALRAVYIKLKCTRQRPARRDGKFEMHLFGIRLSGILKSVTKEALGTGFSLNTKVTRGTDRLEVR
jgi:hypothetical protein